MAGGPGGRLFAAGACAAAVLVVAGCGGGGSVTVQGPNGASINVNPSGISVSGSDGSVVVGGGGSLPEGWPAEVPAPEGFTQTASAKSGSGATAEFTVSWVADGDQSAAVTAYIDSLKAKGFTVTSQIAGSGAGGVGGIYELSGPKWRIGIVVSVDDGKTAIVQSVTPLS